ncbi:MAG: phospholipase, partial [Verrucomicrobia bacterium]|nr:phospholipase [Cytophagales bacterium]
FGGKVGATWMTKEARLDEISDYVNYLNQLYFHVLQNIDTEQVNIKILGFSQGVATVCRWVLEGKIKADALVFYAGIPPEDLEINKRQQLFSHIPITFAFGSEDKLIQQSGFDIENYLSNFTREFPQTKVIRFDAGHVIQTEVLSQLT